MRNATKNYIDQLLFDYPNIDEEINRVMEELKYPVKTHDENSHIPGSNLPSSNIENTVIRIVDSKRIRMLKNTKNRISNALDKMDELENEFIKHYYFAQPRIKTVQGIAIDMNVSDRTCYRLRASIRRKVANECNLH